MNKGNWRRREVGSSEDDTLKIVVLVVDFRQSKGPLKDPGLLVSSAACAVARLHSAPTMLWEKWEDGGQRTVCLAVKSIKEMRTLAVSAKEKGFPCSTEKEPIEGSNICVAIGPADSIKINELTGKLPVYTWGKVLNICQSKRDYHKKLASVRENGSSSVGREGRSPVTEQKINGKIVKTISRISKFFTGRRGL
ncbi:MAG: hypothetical protein GY861_21305 [bacterium]|nr:hypothetical protein [bacterium]